MTDIITYVIIRTEFEGIHRWESAPSEVGYLASDHRHVFVVELRIQVTHNDREIEIILTKRWLDSFLTTRGEPGEPQHLGTQSCEQIASKILSVVRERFGEHRKVICSVLEDGYLGAQVFG